MTWDILTLVYAPIVQCIYVQKNEDVFIFQNFKHIECRRWFDKEVSWGKNQHILFSWDSLDLPGISYKGEQLDKAVIVYCSCTNFAIALLLWILYYHLKMSHVLNR